MTFGTKVQYGILLALYLARAGRASTKTAGLNMGVKRIKLLRQAAKELTLAGVLKYQGGDSPGYELNENPTVSDIVKTLSPPRKGPSAYTTGGYERRALGLFLKTLADTTSTLMAKTIRGVHNDLLLVETAVMESVSEKGIS